VPGVADIGELDELAIASFVQVLGDAHHTDRRRAGIERNRGARALARTADIAGGRGIGAVADRGQGPVVDIVRAEAGRRYVRARILRTRTADRGVAIGGGARADVR